MLYPWKSFQGFVSLGICTTTLSLLAWPFASQVLAQVLPPQDDIPEEVLQSQIFTEARSPIDGKPLTAAEYAQLQAELQSTAAVKPKIAPKLQRLIFLLRVRKVIRSILPFLF